MTLTTEVKERIVEAIKADRKNISQSKHAVQLDIQPSQYTELMKGNYNKQLSDEKWTQIALRLGVFNEWKTVITPTYIFITEQLKKCQESSLSAIFCDLPNIGKTHTAKQYRANKQNVAYIDCSLTKSKRKLIKAIAKEFGLSVKGSYDDMFTAVADHVATLYEPLIILDEAGDLRYDAFLEIKALWNALEGCCGWFMLGAEGLQRLIDRAMNNQKVGFAEIFSRFGGEYQHSTIDINGEMSQEQYIFNQAYIVAKANAPVGTSMAVLKRWATGGLRRLKIEVEKAKIYGKEVEASL